MNMSPPLTYRAGYATGLMRIFGQLLLVDELNVPYLDKTTSKEFDFFVMTTMTFQDGGCFVFKAI